MKSIALALFFWIIIGILIFFSVISVYFKMLGSSEKAYCLNNWYWDEKCKKYITQGEKIIINYDLNKTEEAIAVYIARCWDVANHGYSNRKILCFSIEITNRSIYSNLLSIRKIIEYLKKYSDVDTRRIFFKNIASRSISEIRTLLIFYNGSHIIIW